ncbi:MAG TPA: mannitol-1-phosphate 5-dehydrogenase [archaeon]|nr:mannitol-1-phosphate 5-dehydrogenase [archaeon]
MDNRLIVKEKKKKLLQFGAGNIGRSFIGQLFSAAGYEVVFAELDKALIEALNRERAYKVEIRDRENRTIFVENVRAVDVSDKEAVIREIVSASVCATAVGPDALPHLFPLLAGGLKARQAAHRGPLDIILCENLRGAARITREGLEKLLPAGFPLEGCLGLVETSIGKMVPIIPAEVREEDPLTVYAEAYNTLILDKKGFVNKVPDVKGLEAKENMKAYVDRKAFIHNLGHAALAYYAHLAAPEMFYTYEVVDEAEMRSWVKEAMWESGHLLIKMYPGEFDIQNQEAHIEDLLNRFGNRVLGDTIHRVGRDLKRKLSFGDRVVGPLLEAERLGLSAPWTLLALACGLFFLTSGPEGHLLPGDREVVERAEKESPGLVLADTCGLCGKPADTVSRAYKLIRKWRDASHCLSRKHFLDVLHFIQEESK